MTFICHHVCTQLRKSAAVEQSTGKARGIFHQVRHLSDTGKTEDHHVQESLQAGVSGDCSLDEEGDRDDGGW